MGNEYSAIITVIKILRKIKVSSMLASHLLNPFDNEFLCPICSIATNKWAPRTIQVASICVLHILAPPKHGPLIIRLNILT